MAPPAWLANLGLQKPDINEFLENPDLRQFCSFFLGWLTLLCLYYISHSSILSSLGRKLRITRSNDESNSQPQDSEKSALSNSNPKGDPFAIVFLLDLFVLTTALSQFASLMVYVDTQKTSCVFLVAWGGLGAQTVRLLGLIKLSLHLKELRARRWELWLLWLLLLVSAVLMFLTNAVTKGIVSSLMTPEERVQVRRLLTDASLVNIRNSLDGAKHLSFCYRKHFTFTAGLTSALNLFLELYVFLRILVLRMAIIWPLRRRYLAFADIRVLRALTLLALDGAMLYPALNFMNVGTEFLPFIIGAMFVLIAFNYRPAYGYSLLERQSTSSMHVTTEATGPMLPTITPPSTFRIDTPVIASPAVLLPNQRQHPFASVSRDNESTAAGSSYVGSVGHGGDNFMPSIIRNNSAGRNNAMASTSAENTGRSDISRKPVPPVSPPKVATLQPIVANQDALAEMPREPVQCPLVATLHPMSSFGSDGPSPSIARPPPPRFPRLVQQHNRALSHQADHESLRAMGFDVSALKGSSLHESAQTSPPVTPNSAVQYGSDILRPDEEANNVMKGSSRSASEKRTSNGTSARQSSSSSFIGGQPSTMGKYSRRSSLANRYPFSVQGTATISSSEDRTNTSDGYDDGLLGPKGEKRITFGEISSKDAVSVIRRENGTGSQSSHSNPTTSDEDLARRVRKEKGKAPLRKRT